MLAVAGMDAYVSKPVNADDLIETLEALASANPAALGNSPQDRSSPLGISNLEFP
jgi:hypothetical protein